MNEINDSISEFTNAEREPLTNGIFWHYLASALDPKLEKQLKYEIPFPEELPFVNRQLLKVQGSLIFRLYISLVYMKEGPLLKISRRKSFAPRCDYRILYFVP